MGENKDRNYPEFPRPGGFVEAPVEARANETRAALAEFALADRQEVRPLNP